MPVLSMITQWDEIHSVGASLLLHSCFFIRSFSKHLMTLKSYENIYHANARTELSLAGVLGVYLEVLITLFQAEGQIMSTTLLLAPPDLKT